MEEKILSILNSINPEELEEYSEYLMNRYQTYLRITLIIGILFLIGFIIFYILYKKSEKKNDASLLDFILSILCIAGLFVCVMIFLDWSTALQKLNKYPTLYSIYKCLDSIF